MARIAGFRPGTSPPPVRIAMVPFPTCLLRQVRSRPKNLSRNPGYRIPGARRLLLAERLLDQRHEHGISGVPDIGGEGFTPPERVDASPVALYREHDLLCGRPAQERHDPLRARLEAEGAKRVGREQF